MQGIMYNETISKFMDTLEKEKTYIISNGVINKPSSNYDNVNKDIELSLTQYCVIDEAESLYYKIFYFMTFLNWRILKVIKKNTPVII